MIIPYGPALLPDEKSCEEHFRREWQRGIRSNSEDWFRRVLADWYEKALWNGYSFPPSLLLNTAQMLLHETLAPQVPRYEQWADSTVQAYIRFLEKVRQSSIGLRLREAIAGRDVYGWGDASPMDLDRTLWEAILLVLRRENLQSLVMPLYPPAWLRNRLRRATLAELAEFSAPVAPDDPYCRNLSGLLRRQFPNMRTYCNPFFFPFAAVLDVDSETVAEAGWLTNDEGCRPVLGHMLSPWKQDGEERFNETVAAKYRADFHLRGGGEFMRRQNEFELLVKTPDPSRFPRSFETVARGGVMLPTEAAQDWAPFAKKYLEQELLGTTSLERAHAPILIHIYFKVFLQWKDEVRESWDAIPVSDHLHALMLLTAHDIVLRLGSMRHVKLRITLTARRGRDSRTESSCSFPARDLFHMGTGTDFGGTARSEGLLMRKAQGLSLFRDFPLMVAPRENRAKDERRDERQTRVGHELHVYLRGTDSPTSDDRLAAGTLRLTVGAATTALDLYLEERWVSQELPAHLNEQQTVTPQDMEKHWRACVVHTLLGRVEENVAAAQAT